MPELLVTEQHEEVLIFATLLSRLLKSTVFLQLSSRVSYNNNITTLTKLQERERYCRKNRELQFGKGEYTQFDKQVKPQYINIFGSLL
jgi:hypothetical protein